MKLFHKITFKITLFLTVIIFCLTGLVLIGCSNPKGSDRVVFSVISDLKTFNAVLSQESPNIFGLTYEGLITENPITGEKEPALAKSWEISQDKLKIVFTLRENLKWSDGKPLTAQDVVFSYNELYLNRKIPNNYRDGLRIGESGRFPIVEQIDDQTIAFTISEPFAPFLDTAEFPILPAHILKSTIDATDGRGNPLFLSTWGTDTPPRDIITNGPYQLKSYDTSQRIIFEKNPYYWKHNQPYIQEIVWAIVESTDTSLLQFRSGSLDSVTVTPEYFSLLKQEESRGNFTIYNGGPAYGTTFISFNLNQGRRNGKPLVNPVKSRWFNNTNFRRAIAYALDRQRMINNIYRGLGEPQNSPISVQSPFYDRDLTGYPYDPQQAKSLLLQENFRYNDNNELFDDQGNRVQFTLITNAGNKIREALGSQIKQDLAQIGIQVDFSPIAFNVLVDKLSNSLDWEAHLLGFTGSNEPHSPNIWYPNGNLHTFNQIPQPGQKPIQGHVIADWEASIAEIYLKASQALERDKRKELYREAQQLVQDYLPFTYLVTPYSLSAVRDRFEGIQYSALGGAFWNIDSIKIKEENRALHSSVSQNNVIQ